MHPLFTVVCLHRASSHFTVPMKWHHIFCFKPFYLRRCLGNEHWHGRERNVIANHAALKAIYFSPASK